MSRLAATAARSGAGTGSAGRSDSVECTSGSSTHGRGERWRRIRGRGSLLACGHRRFPFHRRRPRSSSRLTATGAGTRVWQRQAVLGRARCDGERWRRRCGAVRRRCRGAKRSGGSSGGGAVGRPVRRRELEGQVEIAQVERSQAAHRPAVPIVGHSESTASNDFFREQRRAEIFSRGPQSKSESHARTPRGSGNDVTQQPKLGRERGRHRLQIQERY